MKVGVILAIVGLQAMRDNILHTANLAEKEGFDYLWTFVRRLRP